MLSDANLRRIDTLRLSVTDRCDLRCQYCMPGAMRFAPRKDLLTLDELYQLAQHFVSRGVRRIRISGGEPLMRRHVTELVERIGSLLEDRGGSAGQGVLQELTMTSNATMLADHADALAAAGIRRINISLDSRNAETVQMISRRDSLQRALAGIDAADRAGLAIKINMVALKGLNEAEIPEMMRWAHGRGFDLTLIELMPMGAVEKKLAGHYLPLDSWLDSFRQSWSLQPLDFRTGGPARYFRVEETGGRLGIISPLTRNFCADCRRIRVSATGQLYACLGDEKRENLRIALRSDEPDLALDTAIARALAGKAQRHQFSFAGEESCGVARMMSVTGG